MSQKNFNEVVSHMKNYGFVFQGSEIYGGLANTWDFAPLGVELKNNIKNAWWKRFITEQKENVGLQSAILMNPSVWVASGHVGGFSDPLMEQDCGCWVEMHEVVDPDYDLYDNIEMENWNVRGWTRFRCTSATGNIGWQELLVPREKIVDAVREKKLRSKERG